ncbi:MAG: ABC transporter ATP-binding protein, partial [Caldilineaceae bacterium]|nr:ABC transporter ATP-binding protein [Caldilineaceae bacterium]
MGLMRAGLTAENYDRGYTNRELFARIASYFRPQGRRLATVMLLVSALSLSGALLPVLMAQGVNVVTGVAANREAIATVLVVLVIAIGVLNWGINWARRMLTARLLGDVVLSMRVDAFRAVMNHDMSFFDKNQSGRIVSRITTDTDEFSRVAVLVTEVGSQLLLVTLLLTYLFTVNWQLTLLLALLAPVAMIVASTFQRWARRATRTSQEAVADVNASIQEAVTGIRVAKNFRREMGIYEEFLGVNERSYTVHVRRGFVLALIFPTLQLFAGLGTAVLLYAGGYYTYLGIITAGAWFL